MKIVYICIDIHITKTIFILFLNSRLLSMSDHNHKVIYYTFNSNVLIFFYLANWREKEVLRKSLLSFRPEWDNLVCYVRYSCYRLGATTFILLKVFQIIKGITHAHWLNWIRGRHSGAKGSNLQNWKRLFLCVSLEIS